MKSNKEWFKVTPELKKLNELKNLVGELREGDGVSPKLEKDKILKRSRPHKNQQLCKIVLQVLSTVFQGESVESVFTELYIDKVELNSESQYFEVTLRSNTLIGDEEPVAEAEVLAALTRAQGYLRTAVAHAINRKRVPRLRFKYLI